MAPRRSGHLVLVFVLGFADADGQTEKQRITNSNYDDSRVATSVLQGVPPTATTQYNYYDCNKEHNNTNNIQHTTTTTTMTTRRVRLHYESYGQVKFPQLVAELLRSSPFSSPLRCALHHTLLSTCTRTRRSRTTLHHHLFHFHLHLLLLLYQTLHPPSLRIQTPQ